MPAPPNANASTASSSSVPGLGRALVGREAMGGATYPRSTLELDDYRDRAEQFTTEITREGYLQFSGQKEDFEIDAIYERHSERFSREAVDELRGAGNSELLEFAVHGGMGQ